MPTGYETRMYAHIEELARQAKRQAEAMVRIAEALEAQNQVLAELVKIQQVKP